LVVIVGRDIFISPALQLLCPEGLFSIICMIISNPAALEKKKAFENIKKSLVDHGIC